MVYIYIQSILTLCHKHPPKNLHAYIFHLVCKVLPFFLSNTSFWFRFFKTSLSDRHWNTQNQYKKRGIRPKHILAFISQSTLLFPRVGFYTVRRKVFPDLHNFLNMWCEFTRFLKWFFSQSDWFRRSHLNMKALPSSNFPLCLGWEEHHNFSASLLLSIVTFSTAYFLSPFLHREVFSDPEK